MIGNLGQGLEPAQERGDSKVWMHIALLCHLPRLPETILVPCEASWTPIPTLLRLEKCVQQFLVPYLNASISSNWKLHFWFPA